MGTCSVLLHVPKKSRRGSRVCASLRRRGVGVAVSIRTGASDLVLVVAVIPVAIQVIPVVMVVIPVVIPAVMVAMVVVVISVEVVVVVVVIPVAISVEVAVVVVIQAIPMQAATTSVEQMLVRMEEPEHLQQLQLQLDH